MNNKKIYKGLFTAICLIIFFTESLSLNAQVTDTSGTGNNLTKKELRKEEKRKARKEIESRFFINFKTTYAFLKTQLQFTTPQGLLSFHVGLENNLGLEDNSWFISGSFIYRISPKSGLFGMYYGLKRQSTHTVTEDIIFPEDTIKAGSCISPFFTTYVYSFGYLLSLLDTKKSFLGIFFNVYMMDIKTGIKSDFNTNHDLNYRFLAPLPNLGLVMNFRFTKWFHLYGEFGTFFINNINGIGVSVHDMELYANFMPTKWLGLSIGYQGFNVNVTSYVHDYKMDITYSFKGPSAGISLKF